MDFRWITEWTQPVPSCEEEKILKWIKTKRPSYLLPYHLKLDFEVSQHGKSSDRLSEDINTSKHVLMLNEIEHKNCSWEKNKIFLPIMYFCVIEKIFIILTTIVLSPILLF